MDQSSRENRPEDPAELPVDESIGTNEPAGGCAPDGEYCSACPLEGVGIDFPAEASERGAVVSTFHLPARARLNVLRHGERHLLTLCQGVLKFGVVDGRGRSCVAGLRYPGDPIEPYCMLDGGELFLQAALPSTICSIDLQSMERDPQTAARVLTRRLEQVGALLHSAERQHAESIGEPPDVRLANFLLHLFEHPMHRIEPAERARAPLLRLILSRGEIAECLGLAGETVSRALTRMVHSGLIAKRSRDCIRLDDLVGLKRLAGRVRSS